MSGSDETTAVEVLRAVLHAPDLPALEVAVAGARQFIAGQAQTHALVPVGVLERAALVADSFAQPRVEQPSQGDARALALALYAAASGERVDWEAVDAGHSIVPAQDAGRRDRLTVRERTWLTEDFARAAELAGYGPGKDVEDFDVPGVVLDEIASRMQIDAGEPPAPLAPGDRVRYKQHGSIISVRNGLAVVDWGDANGRRFATVDSLERA